MSRLVMLVVLVAVLIGAGVAAGKLIRAEQGQRTAALEQVVQ